jgi:hypothetical protein
MATLNTKTSVVDYLKSTGKDSSYSSRSTLAKEYGIVDYKGTGEQNTALLKALQGAGTPATSSDANKSSVVKDVSNITSKNDAYSFINGTQDSDFASASESDEPKAKSSVSDYKDLMSDFKETITGDTEKPEAINFLDTFNKYRESYGISELEDSLNTLKEKKQQIQDAVDTLNYDEEGKPVALNVITGRQTEEQRQASKELTAIERQIESASNQLNTKYNVINTLMTYTKMDYDTAVEDYNSKFSQNLQLFNSVKGMVDEEKSDAEKAEDSARSNLQIIYNGITSGGVDTSTISSDMKATITKLELQSGLPVGFYDSLKNKNPDSDILSTTTRESNGTKYADVIMKNADGSLSTKSITLGSASGGGGSESTADTKANAYATINSILDTDGTTTANGDPVLDSNGFITPAGLKQVIKYGATQSISKADILSQYSDYLYADDNYSGYGLTAAEIKKLRGY